MGGEPEGRIGTLSNNAAYITGRNANVAILLIHDLFCWTFPNLRLLADHLANEVGCTCYIIDLYAPYPSSPDVVYGEGLN
jgi:hypothetical protein